VSAFLNEFRHDSRMFRGNELCSVPSSKRDRIIFPHERNNEEQVISIFYCVDVQITYIYLFSLRHAILYINDDSSDTSS
jgi:hypothetical protein